MDPVDVGRGERRRGSGTRVPAPVSQPAARIALAIAVVGGAALRLIGIGDDPLWLDEAYSVMFARLPWLELWRDLGQFDHNTPVYYSLLKLWSGAIGWNEASLRSLSVLASIATIPVAYALGLSLASGDRGRAIAAGSAVLVAANPVSLWCGETTRTYALLCLAIGGTFVFAVRIMRRRDESLRSWIALWLCMTVVCWLHNLGTTAIAWIGLALFVWALFQAERRTQVVRRTLLLGVAVVLSWTPALYYVIAQSKKMSAGYWVPPVNTKKVIYAYTWNLGPWLPMERLWLAVVTVLCAAGAVSLARRHRARFEALLLAGALVVPLAIQVAWSVWVVPMLIPWTLSWMIVPMAALLAAACAGLPTRSLRGAALLAVCAVFLSGAIRYAGTSHHPQWQSAVASVADRSRAGDLVVLTPAPNETLYSYYAERRGLNLPVVVLPDVISGTPGYSGPLRLAGCTGPYEAPLPLDDPGCPISTWDGGVWLIAAGREGGEPETAIAAALSDGRRLEHREEWGPFLRASRYVAEQRGR